MKVHNVCIRTVIGVLMILCIAITASAGGKQEVSVDIPFDEIYGLIEALQEAGNNVVGQAGVEIRAGIDKISSELEARLDQMKEIGEDLWKMMYGDISKEIAGVKEYLLKYLNEVNRMAEERIKQIDTALARRLDQISDIITDTIGQIDDVIQRTIKTAEESAINVIDAGEKSIITVLDNASVSIVRIALIIVLAVLLVVVVVLAWKNILPKTVPAIIVTSVLGVLIIALCLTFIFSNTVMSFVFGRKIELTDPAVAQEKGNESYDDLVASAKSDSSLEELRVKGTRVISDLLTAKYVTKDPGILKNIEEKINSINTLLYPPPKPNTNIKLGTFSKYYNERLDLVKKNARILNVEPEVLYLTPALLNINPNMIRFR
jgi:vacuolar-type H+-ATPase subunit H